VITGFTSGIAVSIFSSQVKDLLGLQMGKVPGDFIPRWQAYFASLPSLSGSTVALTVASLVLIVIVRRFRPNWPGFLIAVIAGSLFVAALHPSVATIGTRFGGISAAWPHFSFPHIPLDRTRELFPSSFTIAFLAGVESLLSAVVADGMIGGRHRSNCELVAQGIANLASALFGGLPATGAIARTATNIRSGARSPIAGMMHALFLLLFAVTLAPFMVYVPLAVLAAVLVMVAWYMAEIDSFKHLMRGPVGDRVVLLVTFGLTVMVDLTVAIEVGIVLAAFLFMHGMSEVVAVESRVSLIEEDEDDFVSAPRADQRAQLPAGVEAFQISGPLFFAVANRLDDVLSQFTTPPRVFILRMRLVPLIDVSGVRALRQMIDRCRRNGIRVIFSGLQPQPRAILTQMGLTPDERSVEFAENFADAIRLAL
jgi:SulP family sulfate permease